MVGGSSVGATWSLLYVTPTELKYIYIAIFYKNVAPLGLLAAAINYTFDELLRRSSVFIEKSIFGWGQLRRSYVIASLPNSYGVEIHLNLGFL